MQFITLEDRYGLMEVILFPEIFKKYAGILSGPGPFWVKGAVISKLPGELSVQAEYIERIE